MPYLYTAKLETIRYVSYENSSYFETEIETTFNNFQPKTSICCNISVCDIIAGDKLCLLSAANRKFMRNVLVFIIIVCVRRPFSFKILCTFLALIFKHIVKSNSRSHRKFLKTMTCSVVYDL